MSKPFIIYLTYAYNEEDKVVIVNCHYTYSWNKEQYNYVLELLVKKNYLEFIKQCQMDNIIKLKPDSKFMNAFSSYIDNLRNGVVSFKGDIPSETEVKRRYLIEYHK